MGRMVTVLLGCALAVVVQCAHGVEIPNELEQTIHAYYHAETKADWETVYSLRTEKFRQHVMLGDFVSAMHTYSKGWSFEKYYLVGAVVKGAEAEIKILFTEIPPPEFWQGSGQTGLRKIAITEISVWINEQGMWRCKRAPSRGYLPYAE